jgi:poly(beta-D-mannuronate) lyase
MTISRRTLLCLPLLAALGCQHPAPAPTPAAALAPGMLRSPWDAIPVTPTSVAYNCGPAVPVGADLTVSSPLDSRKNHVSEDVKSAVYSQSSAAVEDLTRRVVDAADIYRSSGSTAAASCVFLQLDSAANNHALTNYMASSEAWEEQNHALRAFAIAFLKVRGAGVEQPQQAGLILQWMETLVRIERHHYDLTHCGENACDRKDHRGLGVAMAAAAIGIAANDNSLFHYATSQYRTAVGDINARGMLHYDTRGHLALKWNLESAAELVQIAEFAEVNGEPLYGYDNGSVHLLVRTVALGLVSSDPFKSYVKQSQKMPNPIEPWEVEWASVYNRRFPDPVLTGLLQQIGPGGVDMWGGEPWDPDGVPDPGM